MLSIESARDRLRERQCLLCICHQHCRPGHRLQGDPIEPNREANCENDETAAENRKHDRKLSRAGHSGQPARETDVCIITAHFKECFGIST